MINHLRTFDVSTRNGIIKLRELVLADLSLKYELSKFTSELEQTFF